MANAIVRSAKVNTSVWVLSTHQTIGLTKMSPSAGHLVRPVTSQHASTKSMRLTMVKAVAGLRPKPVTTRRNGAASAG